MKAINFIGQMIIDTAALTRAANKMEILKLLQATNQSLQHNQLEKAKDYIEAAYNLINQSCHSAYIVVQGLEPLVLNEEIDARNHNLLSSISEKIYFIFNNLFKIKPSKAETNIINFNCFKIRKEIHQIMNFIYETH